MPRERTGPQPAPPPGAGALAQARDLSAARVVAAGMLLSKPSGYARDALLAARFGTGSAMDAYSLAMTVLNAVFDVIGIPIQRVLVAVLVAARERRGRPGLAASSMAVLWAEGLLALAAGVGLLAGAGPVAALLAGTGPARAETAVLIRWLSLLPLAMVLSGYAAAWLQAAQRFTLPAFVGLPLDAAIVGFVLFDHTHGILAAAWGLLVGYFAQYALQWPGLRRFGHRVRLPRAAAALADPGLRSTAAMVLPLVASAAAVEAANLLQQALAARLAVGTVAALGFALRVLDLPSALFIAPAVTVVLPRLAAFAASGQEALAARFFREAAWTLAAGLLPCALLLGLLAQPLAAALYEHGAFDARSVAAMAACLLGFAPAALTYGMQQLLRTRFYARQDAVTPMLWDVAAFGAAAAFDLAFYRRLGGFGLALGWSLGAAVSWAGLARAAGVRGPAAWGQLRALGAGAAALCIVVLALHGHVSAWLGPAPWRAGLARLLVLGPAGAVAYAAATAAAGGAPLLAGLAGRLRAQAEPAARP